MSVYLDGTHSAWQSVGTITDFSTWGPTTQWYAQNMGSAVATTHFVIG